MFFIKHHKLEFLILAAILLVASWFRLYRISEYMTFLGDEGRDVRVVRNLIVNFDPVLIGPMTSVVTSAGHMYLGPLYYYLMALPMMLFGLSPVVPAIMVAFLSLATVLLIWWLGRKWWSVSAGLVAAGLFAISPTVIIYSRSSWNPNMMPFFALLTMWSMFEVWVNKRYKWLLIAGISLAFVLQSHYLGLLIIPVIGLLWFLTLFDLRIINQDKGNYLFIKLKQALSMLDVSTEKKIFGRYTFWSLFIFILLMSPLVIFDARHDWMNSKALMAFFTERQTTINFKFYKGFENLWPILQMVFSSMLTVGNKLVVNVILGFLGFNMIFEFWRKGWRKFPKELYLLILWLVVGVLGLSIYKQSIFDHYFGFLYPVPFMLVGWSYYQIVNLGGIWKEIETTSKLNLGLQKKYAGGILIGSMFLYNLYYSPVLSSPNRQLQKTVEISEKIIDESGGQPFNLALISRHNYDEAYRYVLEWKRAQLVEIEPASAKETITEQLFVICENQPPFESRDDNCDPIAHPKAEIALFGWVEIANMWEFDWGHKLYRLVHIK